MSTQPKPYLTEEEYLEIERKAEFKSEYFRGEMFAMSGAKRAHNLINTNLTRDLSNQVRSGPGEIYSNDMRVRVAPDGLYAYPDVIAVCGEPQFLEGEMDTLLNPNLIVEVLSPSTEAYDRGLKFELYQSIESLTEYMLVSSSRVHVDLFSRQPDGRWLLTSVSDLKATMELQSIGCRVALADLYEKIEFRTTGPTMQPVEK